MIPLWLDNLVLPSARQTAGTLQSCTSRRSLKSGVKWLLVATLSGSQLDKKGGQNIVTVIVAV
jgi:hypothetical protein